MGTPRKIGAFLLLVLAFAFPAAAQTTIVVGTTPEQRASKRVETFEKVWSTVNERHYDPTFGGVDWNKVKTNYEARARNAASDDELHAILRKMLGELRLSHFGIFPKGLSAEDAVRENGVSGVDVIFLDGKPVVNRVETGSGGASAKLRPGYILTSIGGVPVNEIVAVADADMRGRRMTEAMSRIYRERIVEGKLNGGKPGTQVAVGFINEHGSTLSASVIRGAFGGQMSQPFGNFPAQPVIFESRRIEGNIGYFRFNMWVMPQMAKLRAAVREFADADAIIVDLRGNPGGIGGMATGLAGLLVDKQLSLGTMRTRESTTSFVAYPQSAPFKGRVVILTDNGTGSTSEVFAAGMQEAGRGTVIGEVTAGAVLPSVFETLPTGAIFQYAVSDYRSPKNILIEGRGVYPDIRVAQTRTELLAGRDAQLSAAIRLIRREKTK